MIDVTEKHPAWRVALRDGTLHVFRLRIVCPCCREVWYMDVLDIPDQFEIPDRRRLGLAMLCGSCEARRVTRFVVPGKDGWSAPFLTPAEISQVFGRLYDVPRGTWIDVEGKGQWDGGELRDDRRDLFRACTTIARGGVRVNIASLNAETLAASGLPWKVPPPPVGVSGKDGW